ncbi:MAG: hypothetical protein RMI89_02305 [Gloeomargarita sp. SKYBB_i_bin120]|nr:hypothetical protein [Gloeomargarita sp. SKYG98]MCS7291794.1 hypothetical protein [Gloeomargarita sp. SKYB120]MDW8177354.1 hypothetical protein [Gloeomargarita sp. SKYBB_i_bin120]
MAGVPLLSLGGATGTLVAPPPYLEPYDMSLVWLKLRGLDLNQ